MFGCCGYESHKFKNKNGEIDENRLNASLESIDKKVLDKDECDITKNGVKECDCACHMMEHLFCAKSEYC